ncbi:hypothetical protein PVK06_012932 [Gossypium arboreum]|uniref:Uncharacterized protein n=1 Tax=Gossypium arboreum TaxID=29729 RepID=A0ABR0QDL4_GOSAR|nr:hypothetical protein PVK06_012932 [Gossypium arboreum]
MTKAKHTRIFRDRNWKHFRSHSIAFRRGYRFKAIKIGSKLCQKNHLTARAETRVRDWWRTCSVRPYHWLVTGDFQKLLALLRERTARSKNYGCGADQQLGFGLGLALDWATCVAVVENEGRETWVKTWSGTYGNREWSKWRYAQWDRASWPTVKHKDDD